MTNYLTQPIQFAQRSATGPNPVSKARTKVSVLELDIDTYKILFIFLTKKRLEGDKPWRKPGADLNQFFNYGFNEETWRAYCARQVCLLHFGSHSKSIK